MNERLNKEFMNEQDETNKWVTNGKFLVRWANRQINELINQWLNKRLRSHGLTLHGLIKDLGVLLDLYFCIFMDWIMSFEACTNYVNTSCADDFCVFVFLYQSCIRWRTPVQRGKIKFIGMVSYKLSNMFIIIKD